MSSRCAFATSSGVTPGTSWMSMYIGIGRFPARRARIAPRDSLHQSGRRQAPPVVSFVARDGDRRRIAQRLVDHTVALGQPQQRGELLLRCVGVELDCKADRLEADGCLLGDTQRA